MVNRHFLRQKVLQSLYAYYKGGADDKESQEKFMDENISKLYELQIYLLSAILNVRNLEQDRIQEATRKFYPTEEEKNPNLRFVNNVFFQKIASNEELKSAVSRLKIDFSLSQEVFYTIMNRFRQSESYTTYMEKTEVDYEDERKIVIQLFKNYLIKNENLYELISEKGFTWDCDYDYVCQTTLQFLKTWNEEDSPQKSLPFPFDRSDKDADESDKDFIHNLFNNTIAHFKDYDKYIDKRSENWDKDRIAYIDILIIKMAISEFTYCPSIPLRVTLDEYIELAKEFSTEKSRLFVNGVLDRIITDLRIENKIHKKEDDQMLFFETTEENKDAYSSINTKIEQ